MKEKLENLPEVLTAQELAAYWKMSPRWGYQTVNRMAREGKIKGFKVGDMWRFTREHILASQVGKR